MALVDTLSKFVLLLAKSQQVSIAEHGAALQPESCHYAGLNPGPGSRGETEHRLIY